MTLPVTASGSLGLMKDEGTRKSLYLIYLGSWTRFKGYEKNHQEISRQKPMLQQDL